MRKYSTKLQCISHLLHHVEDGADDGALEVMAALISEDAWQGVMLQKHRVGGAWCGCEDKVS
jgi:hypothetical protein